MKKGREDRMVGKIDIPKALIRLILKWMNNKKTGSLQINFIKGEIDSAFLNFAVSLKNAEDRN